MGLFSVVAYHALLAIEFRENVSDFATHFFGKVIVMMKAKAG